MKFLKGLANEVSVIAQCASSGEIHAERKHQRDVDSYEMPRLKKVGADFPNQSDALLAEALRASERVEEKLARLNRTLRTVNECNKALVRATEESELLRSVCQILVDVGGLRMAWVGYRQYNEEKSVRPVAHAGYEAGYLDLVLTRIVCSFRLGGRAWW